MTRKEEVAEGGRPSNGEAISNLKFVPPQLGHGQNEGSVRLENPNDEVMEALDVTDLVNILEIEKLTAKRDSFSGDSAR